jgi:hypothetical protein
LCSGKKIVWRDGLESTLAGPPPELLDVIDDLLVANKETTKDFHGLLQEVKDLEVRIRTFLRNLASSQHAGQSVHWMKLALAWQHVTGSELCAQVSPRPH